MKLVLLVFNPYVKDARVRRAVTALSERYRVTVFALANENQAPFELDGAHIVPVFLRTKQLSNNPVVQIFKFFEFLLVTRKLVKQAAPDIMYCNDVYTLPIAWLLPKIPFVYDSHELWRETSQQKGMRRYLFEGLHLLEKKQVRKARAVITVNKEIALDIASECGVPCPYIVRNIQAWDGTQVDRTALKKEMRLSSSDIVFLYTGMLGYDRDLATVVRSCASWPEKVHLGLMGEGACRNELELLAKSLHIEDRVHFLGLRPHDEVLQWTSGADAGIVSLAATSDNEVFALPNKLFQNAQMRVPLIAVDLPVIRRYVKEYGLGLLYKRRDPGSLTDAVVRFLQEPVVISDDNYNRFLRDCNWEHEKDVLLEVVRKAEPKANGC